MKIPAKPPALDRALRAYLDHEATRPGDLDDVLTRPDYLHWDDLRRRPVPDGASHEALWGGLKLRRRSAKVLPLVGMEDRAFRLDTSVDAVVAGLHRIDIEAGLRVAVSGSMASPPARDRYVLESLIGEAITSSQLEGASTTRDVAQDMLRSGRHPRDHAERMIMNNFMTMQRILELKDERLTPELVLELHRLVSDETLAEPDAAGRLRRSDEVIDVATPDGVVPHLPPPAEQLPKRLRAMCDFANGETPKGFLHPALRAIALHFWLAWEHPFVDGNGRTARALFYWAMLNQGYWVFEFLSISEVILKAPGKYGRAFLLTETDDDDLTYFALYHLDVIGKALDHLRAWIDRKTSEGEALDALLRSSVDRFNARQRELLSHALRHPRQLYTVAEHQQRAQVVYATARADLLDLEAAGLMAKSMAGKKAVFRAPADLEKRLKALGRDAG